LKDTPLVSYPSDQRKLPRAFRCKSIYQEPASAEKRSTAEEAKAYLNHARTPKVIRPSLAKINVQMVKVIQSSREEKERQTEDVGEEDNPVTPAFSRF
jgi:hypothetical protein